MVRTVDYESRKRAILGAAVNRYIKEAEPVSSEDIAGDFSLSSATIRNVFSDLEEAGLLTHPHTSSGRVPTDKGYRYYVDFLLYQIELLDEQKQSIINEYHKEINRLEDILEKTLEVVSAITHYTSIVAFLDQQDSFFYKGISFILDQPEFQEANKMRLLIKMIEDKQKLVDIINRDFDEKVKVYIGQELGWPEICNCSMVVSSYSIKKRPVGRLAILGPTRMEYDHIIPALEYISEVLTDILE